MLHAGFKTLVVASAEAIGETDGETGADLQTALAAAGIAVRTTEGDAGSLVWTLPAVFELRPEDTHRGQREAQQDIGEPDDEEEDDDEG